MKILVLNCGSASIKFELFDTAGGLVKSLQTGGVDIPPGQDHAAAFPALLAALPQDGIRAIGHRVVHGGDAFSAPVRIDDRVLAAVEALVPLAPLHNPPALAGIRAARAAFGPDLPQVACFDTAFHQTMPDCARLYAIPRDLGFRRFGFHGISHQYVMERYAELTGHPHPTIVTLHLGGGCSACAIREGISVDTSMGYTPLEGLIMGTRSGDVDPAIPLALARDGKDADRILNHESGLQALAGTNDMKAILERKDEATLDAFCYRVRKYVGAYLAALEKAEAIVFAGGIGENAAEIRRRVCAGFAWAGLQLDPERAAPGRLSTDGSRLHAWVIPTDEERWIAKATAKVVGEDGA